MRDFKLDDDTWDLLLVNNDLPVVSGDEWALQKLAIRLQFFLGEYYLDTSKGVRFYQDVFKKNPDIPTIDAMYKREIIASPGVNELLSFSSAYTNSTRTYSIRFKVRLNGGTVTTQELEL